MEDLYEGPIAQSENLPGMSPEALVKVDGEVLFLKPLHLEFHTNLTVIPSDSAHT